MVAGRPAALGGRAFDLLLALIEHRDRVVPKTELFDRVWPGLVVEENNLQVQISALRKLLGPAVIVTIPGRGYRFALAPDDAPNQAAASVSASPAISAERAVLPGVPAELPLLYGRADDVTALSEMIRNHALVTVIGPAGIGKTRLALAVADELRNEFADGTRLVELAPLADPALVVVTLARALGLVVGDTRTALDLTVQALSSQRILLIFDNCEHLLEEVDKVVTALRKGAITVRVLATSQEVLRHPDEHTYRLGPLSLPVEATASQARAAGAVQLFTARVQATDPRFQLSDENVGAVVEICRRLDGIPLAIELAAARVPLLGAEGVRERLDERFHFLTAGSRLALRRHQTLRAALEWSYNLLSAPEQAVFDKLGVFAGSFSLEAAQRLATDNQMDEWAVLDHLGAMVDKSLVSVEGGATPRYRMLETTRAFALERLAVRGATSQMMRRHAEVMLALFERFYHDIFRGTPPAKGAAQLAPDIDNLRGALRWASEPGGDRSVAVALLGTVGSGQGYFHYVASKAETSRWCETLRPLVDDTIPPADAARFWLACAEQGSSISPAVAIDDANRALLLYRNLGDRLGAYFACNMLMLASRHGGRMEEARRALDDALELRDPTWPPWVRAPLDNIAGIVLSNLGALSEARAHLLEYLAASRQMESLVDEWTARSILVDLDVQEGNVQQAAATASEMLAGASASREHLGDGRNLRVLATALMSAGRLQEADALYREALAVVKRNFGAGAYVLYDAATLLALRSLFDDSARVFAYAESYFQAKGVQQRRVALRLREHLLSLLAAERSPEVLSRLYDEGRRLTDDEACALAFPPLATKA